MSNTYKPRLDVLEGRALLAANLTAHLTGDVLRIEGTEGPDVITVRQIDGRITVDGVGITVGEVKAPVPAVEAGRVGRVEVIALGGNDAVRLGGGTSKADPLLSIPGRVEGGAGDDTLIGGGAADDLFGQAGNDSVAGNGGDDTLSAGAGDNTVAGGDGADRLIEVSASFTLVDTHLTSVDKFGAASQTGLSGIELAHLTGAAGDDVLDAGAFTGRVTLDGGNGNDVLIAPGQPFVFPPGEGRVAATANLLHGGAGNDLLFGGAADDWVFGDDGDDVFVATAGTDALDGGAGVDRVQAGGDADWTLTDTTLTGVGTAELQNIDRASLTGGDGANTLDAAQFSGPVTLRGGKGNDVLRGGGAGDELLGGEGNDTLVAGAENDTLSGGSDGQAVTDAPGAVNVLDGGTGIDRLVEQGAQAGQWTLNATGLTGSAGNVSATLAGIEEAVLTGGTGDNRINAAAFGGPVTLVGGTGNDTLTGGPGADVLTGEGDADALNGLGGSDTLSGGDGNDVLHGQGGLGGDPGGNNRLDGGTGNDSLFGSTGNDTLSGGIGNDSLSGLAGQDSLAGGDGLDTMTGGDGNDTMDGGAGTDRLKENADMDFVLRDNSLLDVFHPEDFYFDSLAGIERAELVGNSINNYFDATAFTGRVTMTAGGGDDTLIGGNNSDFLSGGAGADVLDGRGGNNSYDPGPADARSTLYVQFDGAAIKYDDQNSTNDLVGWAASEWSVTGILSPGIDQAKDGVVVQPFLAGHATRDAVIAQVLQLLGDDFRPYGVDVVRRDPGDLAVVGQGATTLFVGKAVIDGYGDGLRGIASAVDHDNDNQTDVGFVVKEYEGTDAERAQFAANTAAHEAGHTFGLKHVTNLNGFNELMRDGELASDAQNAQINYAFLNKAFQAGSQTQNSHQVLTTNLSGTANRSAGGVMDDVAEGDSADAVAPAGNRVRPAEFVVFGLAAPGRGARLPDGSPRLPEAGPVGTVSATESIEPELALEPV